MVEGASGQEDGGGASRLPVLQSTLEAFWLLRRHASVLLRTGWLLFLMLSLCAFAVFFLKGAADEAAPPSLLTSIRIFALTMISIAADIMLLVRWYRVLVLPQVPDPGLRLGRRELRVLLAMVSMGVCVLAPLALVSALLTLAGKAEDPAAALPLLLSLVLCAWLYCRLMLMPALAALDAGGPLLTGSWRIMKGYAVRAFAITLLASVPLIGLGLLGLALDGAAGLLLDLAIELVRTLLLVAVSAVIVRRIAPLVDPVY